MSNAKKLLLNKKTGGGKLGAGLQHGVKTGPFGAKIGTCGIQGDNYKGKGSKGGKKPHGY